MAPTAAKSGLAKPLKVCILWHMHQPDYRDPISGQTLLPWTWLHGLKDYGEMLETIAETGARVTVNLVPTLLEQLERYADGSDRDSWLELATRQPNQLSENERQFIVQHFFSVNQETQVLPNRRYHQLFRLRGTGSITSAVEFDEQDLRDLQVWFLLAWTGSHLRRKQAVVKDLLQQGENFSEEQKQRLLEVCHAEVGRTIELHRQLEEQGLIEISVTPYAHPILPLLCDLHMAQAPSPGLPLPGVDFRHPEDSRLQVREGLATANRILGARPRGMWPAEGSVSEDAAKLLKEEGALWAATDEDILARSLDGGMQDRNRLYRIYQYGDLPLIFRDRELSDRIGFLYAGWDTGEAVGDVLNKLRKIATQNPGETVPIILDGENCWERYPDNGYPFLRELYTSIQQDPQLQLCTVKEAIAASKPIPLKKLAAGSWIRSDFTTWIGHPEENLAWELLAKTREEIISDEIEQALANPEQPLSELVRELLRAEGSDWFWWFGDEHVTAQADIFDRLFRLHLESLYHLKGLPVPARLHQWIKPPSTQLEGVEPSACFTPQIDGRIGDYFEWLAAGKIDLAAGGAMYASRESLQEIHYGYNSDQLFFRIDEPELLRKLCGDQGCFELRLTGKQQFHIYFSLADSSLQVAVEGKTLGSGSAACEQVLEIAVPIKLLALANGDKFGLSCHAHQDGRENGRWPTEGSASFCYLGSDLDDENWSV
ncbi:Alpha-amylase/alpha-mannosidase, GH57 family [Malonomonas rubra DSM 5091]|uniref:Alpha-amylase/alpha-mannosidase, GH57 family n=1 Tax=Malonomonas rubra DSM 5091 TaxID=1122189 RepID=A0A1M6J9B3_MALRU|nr:glycoside hydrolase family 57 protein [Malonomonas rubra]SHJ43326.1 Alpha-amylase/alpha-mannosidase, GH57 family [Malonomonas rubra DSM 5091]